MARCPLNWRRCFRMADRQIDTLDVDLFRARLRAATPARIALRRTGVSIATIDHLAFQLAHALARDAVHEALDVPFLTARLAAAGWEGLAVTSEARDRQTYLARPDLGRRLSASASDTLSATMRDCDVAFVVADGLSARAVSVHAVPVLAALVPRLAGLRVGPVVVATQARVALGDAVGAALHAKLVCVLIGERPGLSSPDSLGIYLTFAPAIGRTDAQRNCLSNIRPAGMSYDEAAARCAWLIREAFARRATGVALKDGSDAGSTVAPADPPRQIGS